jgi:hypothetical protein
MSPVKERLERRYAMNYLSAMRPAASPPFAAIMICFLAGWLGWSAIETLYQPSGWLFVALGISVNALFMLADAYYQK